MKQYRIGVIGHTGRGNYGHSIDMCWLQIPGCDIVGVADPDEAGRAEAARRLGGVPAFEDYRRMLDELRPDVVSICPRWVDQHRDMVLACAQRGVHMYMEKPLCRDLIEADEIVGALDRHRVKLALAHQTRYNPKLPVIQQMIGDGLLGDILELRGRGLEDHRGGAEDTWVLGCHIFNLMHYFAGEPQWCLGRVMQDDRDVDARDVRPGNEGLLALAGDNVAAMFAMPGGVNAYFASRRNAAVGGSRLALTICGSKGVIELRTGYLQAAWFLPDPNWSPGRSGAAWQPISSRGLGEPETIARGTNEDGNVVAAHDLLSAIEGDRPPLCDARQARLTIEMASAIFTSHRRRGPVTFPLQNRKHPLLEWR